MTIDDIAVLAYQEKAPDLHDMSVPQWLLWYRLRDVYRAFRSGRADKDSCETQKTRWMAQYVTDQSDWVRASEVHQHLAQFWKDIEEPARRYAFDQNAQTAADFFAAVYRVPLKTQKEQWEKEDAV